jgi:Zn-dependent protease
LALAIFNLIPLHPLDGGKILARFLPESANAWLEENQMTLNVVLIVAMIMGGLKFLAIPIAFIKEFLIEFVTNPVLHIMIGVMG